MAPCKTRGAATDGIDAHLIDSGSAAGIRECLTNGGRAAVRLVDG
jgi:hypothetical protein